MRKHLRKLVDVLERNGKHALASRVSEVLSGSDADVDAILVSNDLWGGSGSIADQGGIGVARSAGRREVEAVLIDLGDEQLRIGRVKPSYGYVGASIQGVVASWHLKSQIEFARKAGPASNVLD